MKYLIIIVMLAGCTLRPTPENLKKKDALVAKCKEDCLPREANPFISYTGEWACECKP